MRCIGWDIEDYFASSISDFGQGCLSDSVLTNLAGNAFSAYACTPMVTSMCASLGMPVPLLDVENDDLPGDDDDDVESAESSDHMDSPSFDVGPSGVR